MNKLKVNQMLNDLKSANYCCHRIIELNEELEVLNHKMLGLSHNPIRLTKEQEKSNAPMPTFQKVAEINYYRRRLNECKAIELLSLRDQNILFDLYFWNMNAWDVAEKYGYTKNGMYKHIRREIGKLV